MQSFISILREVRDPRDINARHPVGTILFLTLAATLCGAKSCVEVADFVEGRAEELSAIVDLPYGAPSHDTFSRLFRLLDPAELAKAFTAFMTALRAELGLGSARGVVAIDGKSLRRGYEKGRNFLPPLMVSVWDSQTRLAIAQRRAQDGNEVAATLDLLHGLVLKGCTVTADALHCHPAMAEAVLNAKADYALGLKANNGPLYAEAERLFAQAGADVLSLATEEKAHGRIERRRASVLPAPPAARALLPGLKALGRIEAERIGANGKSDTATRYIALSRKFTPTKMAEVVRAHWSIENQLHWILDVVFDEDDARTRKDYGPENLAVIRRLAQNILRMHPSNHSISGKMRRALWSKEYFFSLFTHLR
ncbi:MAG: ISAs1 family transposase [Acidobacteriia bacterium]|nr:ISAs1 family transposase [Terriglobia bacterium]